MISLLSEVDLSDANLSGVIITRDALSGYNFSRLTFLKLIFQEFIILGFILKKLYL